MFIHKALSHHAFYSFHVLMAIPSLNTPYSATPRSSLFWFARACTFYLSFFGRVSVDCVAAYLSLSSLYSRVRPAHCFFRFSRS